MKPRTLHTIKLLAVAAAGCTRAVGPEVGAEPVASPPAAVEIPKAAAAPDVVAPEPVQAAAPAEAPRPIPPLPAGAQGIALVALRDELAKVGAETASQRTRHFRPLCDKDGYPLVGNLVLAKSIAPDDVHGPTAMFCAEVRKQAKR